MEDFSSLQLLVDDAKTIAGDFIFISLSPEASYAFDRRKINYKSLHDYCRPEERYQIGLENFNRINRITTLIDTELREVHKNPSLSPSNYSIIPLKVLFDGLWNTIHILKTIIDIEQPDFIRIYTSYPMMSSGGQYAFSNDTSAYSKVLTMDGWKIPVTIINHHKFDSPKYQLSERKNCKPNSIYTWLKKQDLLFNLALIGKREGVRVAVKAAYYCIYYSITRQNIPIILYNSGYNWDDSLFELYRAGICPVYRITDEKIDQILPSTQRYRETIHSICNSHPMMKEYDKILGIDVSDFFFKQFEKIIGDAIQESLTSYDQTRDMIRCKKIRGLLRSVHVRAIGQSIVQAAHDEKILVFSWQHGGAGYYFHPIMPFIEFIHSDYHFVFGEGVSASYQKTVAQLGLKNSPIFIPVGSRSLEICRKFGQGHPHKKSTPTILYVTSKFIKNMYNIPYPDDPSDYDEHLWFIQRQVLNLAKKNKGHNFILKLYQDQEKELFNTYIRDHNITNVRIITNEMNICDLTDIVDLVILDLISTSILQVLTTELPVFTYLGLSGLDHDPIQQLQKRVYVFNDYKNFIYNIDAYLRTKKVENYPVDLKNREFMIKYGTNTQTHNSAKTAVSILKSLIH